jgi:ATP-dependent DNA helicase 2 subunit 1
LQAIALGEEIPEFKVRDDKTTPKYKQIDERAGPYVIEWGEALEKHYNLWAKNRGGSVGVKREAEEIGGTLKKQKVTVSSTHSGSMTTEELKKLLKAGKLSKLTVTEMKEWLTNNGLETAGKKADLVDRIEQWFEDR